MSEEFRVWADSFRKKPFTVDDKEIDGSETWFAGTYEYLKVKMESYYL